MIYWIPSTEDTRLEPYRHVGDVEWLRQHDLFVAEGRLVVDRLIALERFAIASILVNPAAHDALLRPLSSVDTDVYLLSGSTERGGCSPWRASATPTTSAACSATPPRLVSTAFC
jgi:hypothetical protein